MVSESEIKIDSLLRFLLREGLSETCAVSETTFTLACVH